MTHADKALALARRVREQWLCAPSEVLYPKARRDAYFDRGILYSVDVADL